MPRGGPFAIVSSSSRELDQVQRNVADVFTQLEEYRRGLLAAPVVQKTVASQLGEALFVEYVGDSGATLTLPSAAVRGVGRMMAMFIANGSGGNITVRAPGNQTVAGGATITLATGVMAMLAGNGFTKWYRVS